MTWNSMAGDKTWKFMEYTNDDESIAEVESKVLTVLKKFDENISHQDIDVVHRLGKLKKRNQHHCQIYLYKNQKQYL